MPKLQSVVNAKSPQYVVPAMKGGGGFMGNFLVTACQNLIFSDEVVKKWGFRQNLSECHHRDSIVVFNY
jgi:hypothetical protein